MTEAGDTAATAERERRFLALSAMLTGIGPASLAGTGQAGAYLRLLDAMLPAGLIDAMLARFGEPPGSDGTPAAAESAGAALFDDARLGPVAQHLVLLWYRGAWTQLPAEWRAAYGASPEDRDRLISGDAYRSGLQWRVAGAHASGADPQGFGAWALRPTRGALP